MIMVMSGCFTYKSVSVDDIKDAGYTVNEEGNGRFYITDNGADYYFYNSNGKSVFENVVIKLPANSSEAQARGLEAEVKITKKKGKKMTVLYTNPTIKTYSNGNEEIYNFTQFYEFKDNFEEENLTNTRGFADIRGHYSSFTSNRLSPYELNNYYVRGFELEEELNTISN